MVKMKNKQLILFSITFVLALTMLGVASGAVAVCAETISDSFISCGIDNLDCDFGFQDELTNISIVYKPTTPGLINVNKVRVLLCEDQICAGVSRLDQLDIIPNDVGGTFTSTINCPNTNCLDSSSITQSGIYFIKAIIDPFDPIDNPNGINKEVIREINFKKKLIVLLNCDLEGVVDRDVKCTYKIRDSDTNNLVSSFNPSATVTQGQNPVTSIITSDSITFSTSITGGIRVDLNVDKLTYLNGFATTLIQINHPVNEQLFTIDNQDFFGGISTTGISVGTHELKMVITKSGQSFEINNIKAKIITPSGQEQDLTFNKQGDNTFKTTFNFPQAGSTYVFKGEIFPESVNEDSILFEYPILVAGDVVSTPVASNLFILIGGGIAGFIIIAVILFFVFRPRGRR